MKKILLFLLALLLSVSLFGCSKSMVGNEGQYKKQLQHEEDTNQIVYKNTKYGFDFSLPESWKNYIIINDKWEGYSMEKPEDNKIIEFGPQISIRHPQWTSENPRQDIPIMIFTLNQWDLLQQGKFHIGAAPMNPSKLGQNDRYVFALPARYNYAFPTGYKEVEDILKSNPLKPNIDSSEPVDGAESTYNGITVNFIKFERVKLQDLSKDIQSLVENDKMQKGYKLYNAPKNGYKYLAVFAGQKPTTGYGIKITAVTDNEGITNVTVTETSPKKDERVAEVITYPIDIVKLTGITDNINLIPLNKGGKLSIN